MPPAGGILASWYVLFEVRLLNPRLSGGTLAVGSVLSESALRTRPRQATLRLSICSCSSRRMVFKTFYDWRGEGVFPRASEHHFPTKSASLPRMFFRASLPGMIFPASLPDGVGITSAEVFLSAKKKALSLKRGMVP